MAAENRTRSRIWIHLALAAVCLVVSGMSAAQEAKRLYSEKCANCHGADGSGHTTATNRMKVPDLRSKRVQQKSDDDLYAATAQGTSHESYPHAFLHTGMTEVQIRNLVRYIRTFDEKRK